MPKCEHNTTQRYHPVDTTREWFHSRDMRKGLFIFLVIFFAFLTTDVLASMRIEEPNPKDILSIVSNAASFKHITDPIDCYRLFDSNGKTIGAAAITTNIPPEVGGYRDEIAILVGINEAGMITGVKLLAHQEDQEHMDRILSKGFLNRFIKHSPAEKWDDIEAVTGATISSDAMREDIHTASLAVLQKVIKSGVLSTTEQTALRPSAFSIHRILTPNNGAVILLIALSIAAVMMPKRRILRSSTLLLSFIGIGILFDTPVTIGNFVDLFRGILPQLNNLPLLLLLIFAIASALWKGPLYCSYLCPFGAMQDGASGLKLPKCNISDRSMRYAGYIRWAVLLLVIIAIAGFHSQAFRKIEPFALCFAPNAGTAVWIQSGIILVVALFLRRPWCRLFCPTGLLVEYLSLAGAKIRNKLRRITSMPDTNAGSGVGHGHYTTSGDV